MADLTQRPMTSNTSETLRLRIDAIKAGLWRIEPDGRRLPNTPQGAAQSAMAVLRHIYGDHSPQLAALQERLKPVHGRHDIDTAPYNHRIATEIDAILDAAFADFSSGITASLRVRAKGEVLGDFVALAREALAEHDAGADHVAAVLTAAALEETLKQLGSENGVDVYHRDFRGVIQKLKDAGVLTGAQPGVASGFAIFRDRSFHGQFDEVERATTESALAFAEGLLSARMS